MTNIQQITLWSQAHQLTLSIYHTTQTFPSEEAHWLIRQLRQTCSSIPITMTEAYSRGNNEQTAAVLQLAMSSMSEVDYYLLLAHDLNYLGAVDYESLHSRLEDLKTLLNTSP